MRPALYKKLFTAVVLLSCLLMADSSANAASSTRDLTIGSSGSDVSALQQFLIETGFLKISAPTGYFGPMTKSALGTWQALAGVQPSSGYFGPLSRGRIAAAAPQSPTAPIAPPVSSAETTTPIATASTTVAHSIDGSPVRLIISKLGVDAGFQYDGLKSDGTIDIPTNIYDAGWYTGSAKPGEQGVAVITGHVAQIRRSVVTKQGIFYNLTQLVPGDTLTVINDRGQTTTFVVRESRLYDPAADATGVFTANDNGAHLNIITCEGTWNQSQFSYSQRLVVFTDAVR